MPTIPDYESALRQRRSQLESTRTQVLNQQFQRPIVQQRVLRQLNPQTSQKVRMQVKKLKTGFEQSRQEALSEIDAALQEQTQMENELAPIKSDYARANAINAAINVGIKGKPISKFISGLSSKDKQFVSNKVRELVRAAERRAFREGVSNLKNTMSGSEKVFIDGLNLDYKKGKILGANISGVESQFLGQSLPYDVYEQKIQDYQNRIAKAGSQNYSPVNPYVALPNKSSNLFGASGIIETLKTKANPDNAVQRFVLKVQSTPKSFSPKSLGIRPTNINLLGNLARAEPGKILPSYSKKKQGQPAFYQPNQVVPISRRVNYSKRIKWF